MNSEMIEKIVTMEKLSEVHQCHKGLLLNSLWPDDAIWRYGTRSTLDQVMACCLMAPSHYVNQCWLIISEVPLLHLRALSLDDVKIQINKIRLKIAVLKWHLVIPGANELISNSVWTEHQKRYLPKPVKWHHSVLCFWARGYRVSNYSTPRLELLFYVSVCVHCKQTGIKGACHQRSGYLRFPSGSTSHSWTSSK